MIKEINVLHFLEKRGFFYQIYNKLNLYEYIKNKNIFLYCGFDPTASSLHVGHLLPILCLKHFQNFGHTPIVLVGGATSLVGDPSFRIHERPQNSLDILQHNQICLEKQLSFFFNDSSNIINKAIIVNNYSWFKDVSILYFLKKVGIHFSINKMIHKESVKKRLIEQKNGMSFTEFSYSLLQAYDFLVLYKKYGVKLQIGGSDQGGNILSGIRLIRKLYKEEVFGITNPLLVMPNGEKFGKTGNNTIWLDSTRTSPYKFYQFWVNISDSDVNNFIQLFTSINIQLINFKFNSVNITDNYINKKVFLAEFVTKFVHGQKALNSVKRIVYFLFGRGSIQDIKEEDFTQLIQDGIPSAICSEYIDLSNALVKTGLSSSLRQARNMIISGAIRINSRVQTKKEYFFNKSDLLYNKYTLLCRGKKNYVLIFWKI
ncbi:Tyrosine--tRNA ligase [Buchnera aphidicola (Cinara kochiana kochiana)]|uniref:Tyrosine--tRNA ligase n=1 Tax=Buchnera aphidicola (Cinara kochiana kochiana) TaxID=2518976 RepID=A0A451D572_9GAMM|nr:tyrosine--tRNA ligase [Buchnera aphidicola]VFP81000.1 Tyrosine--tRNA ligase [Buchnera aphidicola (Cinara kochiana kochiana)]